MRLYKNKKTMIAVMFLCLTMISVVFVFFSNNAYADTVTVHNCAAMNDLNSQYYLNQEDLKKVCTDEVRKKICGNRSWESCADEGKGEEKVGEIQGTVTEDDATGKGSSKDDEEKKCIDAKGAESLGWIVCPILTWVGNASSKVYDEYVQPSLEVEPELFTGGDASVRQAWEIFRDIANVAFIILFLVVIFSQVTGVGIDNYGVKKILPKLIIVAVLINLSYLICLTLVDVSNILGNGLQSIFNGFSMQLGSGDGTVEITAIEESKFMVEGSPTDTVTIGSVLVGVGLLAAAVTMIGYIWTHPHILISLLVAGFSILVAIFFLFILLAARKAAIIVLTVISPIAMACYMLPNTKKFFSKWMSFFEGLLLVYPIAGFLVSAGDFVSRLLLSETSDFFTWFTAMVVGVVPIFFIPVVLKGSFSAMGKVGGMLAGMGGSARKRATGAIKRTDRYNRLMNAGKERSIRKGLEKRSGMSIDANGNVRERKNIRNKLNKSRLGKMLGLNVAAGKARSEYMKMQSDRMRAANNMNANIAAESMQNLKTELENQRIKADVAVELGPKPVMDKDNMRTRMQNEYNELRAGNKVEAVPIDEDTYRDKLEAQQSIEREKMFNDNYSRMSMDAVQADLSQAIKENDSDRASAAIKNLVSRGGIGQALNAAKGADWSKMDNKGKDRVAKAMGETGVDAFKGYSAYRQSGGSAAFDNWTSGNLTREERDSDAGKEGLKNTSYLQHLMDGGVNKMVNMQKDEVEFISKNTEEMKSVAVEQAANAAVDNATKAMEASGSTIDIDAVRAQTESSAANAFDDNLGARIKNAAIYSSDAGTKKAANDVIESGTYSAQNLGFDKAEDFVKMDNDVAKAVNVGLQAYVDGLRKKNKSVDEELNYKQAIAHEYSRRIAADSAAGTKIQSGASSLLKEWDNSGSNSNTLNIDHGDRVTLKSGVVLPSAQDKATYGGDTSNIRPDVVDKAKALERAPEDPSRPSIILPPGVKP